MVVTALILMTNVVFPSVSGVLTSKNYVDDNQNNVVKYEVSFQSFDTLLNLGNSGYQLRYYTVDNEGNVDDNRYLRLSINDLDNNNYEVSLWHQGGQLNVGLRMTVDVGSYFGDTGYDFYPLKYDNGGLTLNPSNFTLNDELVIDIYLSVFNANIYLDYFENGDATYESGYYNGYQQGYQEGYQNGNTDGTNSGYNNGYDDGWLNGYNSGYDFALTTHDFSFSNLFYSIGDTPILMIRRLFGFELFGVSLISVFMSLFTALIVIHIIKKVF